MMTFLIVLHVMICILLIVTVLLQFGKGAELGAVMGGGASQAVFSSSAKGNFMTKLTTILAVGFMVNSIILTYKISADARRSAFDTEAPVAAPLSDMEDLDTNLKTAPAEENPTPAQDGRSQTAEPVAPVPATKPGMNR